MAATISGALKAYIESLGLSLSAYRDRVPANVNRPYVTISEDISEVPDGLEDGTAGTSVQLVQVDLWQAWRSTADESDSENMTLAPALIRALQGAKIAAYGTPSTTVYLVVVRSANRLIEDDNNIVHHAITLGVYKTL